MTVYAQFAEHTAGLWTPFGRDFALRLFGPDVLSDLPRFTRGKHKGEIKAVLRWRKVLSGGWVKDGPSGYNGSFGHVESRRGKIIEAEIRHCKWPEPYGDVIKTLSCIN